ncbi:MAG: C4-type zinc ribbon domain-containing protein [Syntrophales bacterium]|nr:C4-type zinc ribbon domain-containing protein [Syntrophales bacterium]MCK9527788.1 C4-type zinc ribbon domain-containing protein [Syntrophales bacterium]MDX9922115.1 C4-type zinc ribbon domain-containing protein [Syntrophales bacterium]
MKEQITLLIELQRIESDLAGLEVRKHELPRKRELLEENLAAHENRLKSARERLESLRGDHRARETDLAAGAQRIKKAKSRLLEVKTNKEYEATLKEIDSITDANGMIEDVIIGLLDEIDRTVGIVAEETADLEERRNIFRRETKQIDGELGSIDSRFEDKNREQNELRSRIASPFIKKFDLIRGRRNGRVVVAVRNEVCDGCHMNIPPQMFNDLIKSEELMLCPHCSRIIYCEDPQPER